MPNDETEEVVEISEEELENEFNKDGEAVEEEAGEQPTTEETPAEDSQDKEEEVKDEGENTEKDNGTQEGDTLQKQESVPEVSEKVEEEQDIDSLLDGLGETKIGSGEQETTLKGLKEEYPAVYDAAKIIAQKIAENMLKPWQSKIDAITKREEASAAERQIEENRQALERAMPGSLEILGSDKFIAWYNKQSKRVRDLAGEGSDLEDHKSLMSLYNSANPAPTKTRVSIPSISRIGKTSVSRPKKMTLTDEEMEEEFFRE